MTDASDKYPIVDDAEDILWPSDMIFAARPDKKYPDMLKMSARWRGDEVSVITGPRDADAVFSAAWLMRDILIERASA